MATSRRQVLKGALLSGAGVLAAGLTSKLDPRAAAATGGDSAPKLDALAAAREASPDELGEVSELARSVAVKSGFPAKAVETATATATMSLNPRGNQVALCALILSDSVAFILAAERGADGFSRLSGRALWTDGKVIRQLDPGSYSTSLELDATAVATAAVCCAPGAPVGTCCTWDFQGLFECCAPCAFTFGNPITFVACVSIWCYYCFASHCTQWWYVC